MDSSDEKKAWLYAVKLLRMNAKSRRDLGQKLEARGFPGPVVARVLNRLEEAGFLSDKNFAMDLFARLRSARPTGKRRVDFEMSKRGIPEDIRDELLQTVSDEQEVDLARAFARQKWNSLGRLPAEKRKKRVCDSLVRRGFDFQVVREVADELEIQEHEDELGPEGQED